VWYVAAYDPSTEVLWGALLSASGFRIGAVACAALAGWTEVEIHPVYIGQLAIRWLARRWSAAS
jgi:hypothetical protein